MIFEMLRIKAVNDLCFLSGINFRFGNVYYGSSDLITILW